MTYINSITQKVIADPNNSSTDNLDAGNSYMFTGTASNTLGVAGLQVSLFTDQNATILVEQSPDGTNWDLSDEYEYYANSNFGITVQAISSYWRVVVSTDSLTTTEFRLHGVLCPIVDVVPRSLDERGHFQTSVHHIIDEYGFEVENTPSGEMRVVEPVRLIGSSFEGTTVDPNFWTATVANSATVAQANAQIVLETGTNTAASAKLASIRRARFVTGYAALCRIVAQVDSGIADNVRRWGIGYGATMPTVTDGAFFILNGTTFGISVMKGGVEVIVSNGDFNGDYGKTFTVGVNTRPYEIYYTNGSIYFAINGKLLHTVQSPSVTWAATMNFYAYADNINSGSSTTKKLTMRTFSISRLGKLETDPTYRQITTATTTICKYGAGRLHKIIVNNPTNHTITVYDNTAASGAVIAIIDPDNGATPFVLDYGLPFSNGLTIVTAGTPNVTVTYE